MEDRFYTIEKEARAELKIKGSRFIGESFLVHTPDEAFDRLNAVRKREYAATHHCYAWQTGLREQTAFKYSDDGEPNGTAGKPIYDVVLGGELTDILLVVTRYFGGTKLGTGGLARAYGDTAKQTLEKSGRKENFLKTRFRLELEFSLYDRWLKKIHALGATVTDSDFAERVTLTAEIRQSKADQLEASFIELTGGKGKIDRVATP
ncbi:MAG: IMPACT family protein [Candidatus Zixiibacteriota bacterium]